jgi:hypothetical protein
MVDPRPYDGDCDRPPDEARDAVAPPQLLLNGSQKEILLRGVNDYS